MAISSFQIADKLNFSERGYLLANKDVAEAGVNPRQHLIEYGIREGRRQVNGELLSGSEYRRKKFERFKDVLSADISAFPAKIGDGILSLESYLAESANEDFGAFVNEADANPEKLYLDIGCGLRKVNRDNILYLEVYPSLSADLVVEPNCTYPIKDASLDGVGCFAVLEHTRKPWLVVEEMNRMLKPGGKAFIDWPFLQPVHGFPSHYYNATREGLKALFEDNGFEINLAATGGHQTPDHTITWVVGKFLRDLPKDKQKKFGRVRVRDLVNYPPGHKFWNEILEGLPDAMLSEFGCGNHLIATKRK